MSTKPRLSPNNLYLRDSALRLLFKMVVVLLSSFLIRLVLALSLLPLYIAVKIAPLLPIAICKSALLLSKRGRDKLISSSDSYRDLEKDRAAAQSKGDFKFQDTELLQSQDARGSIEKLAWDCPRKVFDVAGAQVNVFHKQPGEGHSRSGKKILLLHGNPSWSFMWRNVSMARKKTCRMLSEELH
jgi:hypothetical protein